MLKLNGSKEECLEWRWIPGLEGRYIVSDSGLVARIQKLMRRQRRSGGQIYHTVSITSSLGHSKKVPVEHLALLAFKGPRPSGYEACHENDIGIDNRISNLRWDTKTANRRDAIMNGRGCRFKPEAMKRIRKVEALLNDGYGYSRAAKLAGTGQRTAENAAFRLRIRCRCGHIFGMHRKSCHCGCPRFIPIRHESANKARGERHPSNILNARKVRKIRILSKSTSQRDLARRFGVARGTIVSIQKGESWSWLN